MDTSAGLEAADSRLNPEDEVLDEEVEFEDNVKHMAGSSSGMASQDLFSTPEGSSQSQQSVSGMHDAGEESPADALSEPNRITVVLFLRDPCGLSQMEDSAAQGHYHTGRKSTSYMPRTNLHTENNSKWASKAALLLLAKSEAVSVPLLYQFS
ncbi:hypothetical protein UY3_05339 [Chelonia mydas]|uniref:Uncharacterized protein n=1 Tax=Chelonia mydas TaxID=8469 RepID=M7BHZ1_CHEMY|nr:hypothetical protein UY3_05339 [Chelonia mydas]